MEIISMKYNSPNKLVYYNRGFLQPFMDKQEI